ncbi:septum formation initiator family protein [Anaerofustis sp.]|uniref:FtsB family cell division protein n=1 Tax=Anaerofustis sp. TaxID=1872517 RepID=UPI0025BA1FF9|nr:septum formation initiator family protein [Anaerofustis sp.]
MRKEEYPLLNTRDSIEAKKRKVRRRRKKAGRKKRVVLLIVTVAFVLFAGRMLTLEYKYYSLNKTKNELTEQIANEQLKSKELKEEINNSDSKSYIEYLAKKYLGLIYPDEKVYVTNEKDNK